MVTINAVWQICQTSSGNTGVDHPPPIAYFPVFPFTFSVAPRPICEWFQDLSRQIPTFDPKMSSRGCQFPLLGALTGVPPSNIAATSSDDSARERIVTSSIQPENSSHDNPMLAPNQTGSSFWRKRVGQSALASIRPSMYTERCAMSPTGSNTDTTKMPHSVVNLGWSGSDVP